MAMPYRWTDSEDAKTLRLWPHQSMTPQGFVWFIGTTAAFLALPLLAVVGTAVAWVLLIFFAAAVWGVWRAIMANQASRNIHEELTLSGDELHLAHVPDRGAPKTWDAHRNWVTVHMSNNGPVERYLTLRGGGREVELGAFLTPEERTGLYSELNRVIRQ